MNIWELLDSMKFYETNKNIIFKQPDTMPPLGTIDQMLLNKKEAVRFAKELINIASDILEIVEDIKD